MLEIPYLIIFFLILSNSIRINKPISLCSIFTQISKVSYIWSDRTLPLISIWLGVANDDMLHISIATSCCEISVLPLLWERGFSSFKYCQNRDPILETPKPIQKISYLCYCCFIEVIWIKYQLVCKLWPKFIFIDVLFCKYILVCWNINLLYNFLTIRYFYS